MKTQIGMVPVYEDENGNAVIHEQDIEETQYAGHYEDDDDSDFDGYDDDEEDDDEFGRRGGNKRRNKRRISKGKTPRKLGPALVSGTETLDDSGQAIIKVNLQHDLYVKDLTFEGSSDGATITGLKFGDHHVWSHESGIPASLFGSQSLLRGLLKGAVIEKGLDIVVTGQLEGAGKLVCTFIGQKPRTS